MKKRFIIGMLAVTLAVGGVGARAIADTSLPATGQLSGVTTVGAMSLKVEATAPLTATSSGFTYQGRLKDGINPVRGAYDFQFTLYDALSGGSQIGSLVQITQTPSEGLFTVILDFGAGAFNGDARYLEIAVRPADVGGFVTLSPRQPITPAPYALYSLKTKGYKNVVTVAQDGGDFTSVQAALNSITTNSATNKYLVWVGPGVYTERVTMKQFVDIEGGGELTTKITFTGNTNQFTGTLVGASNAEVRSLTVENTGGDIDAIAIYNNSASPSLLHVTARASGGTTLNLGVSNENSSSPRMTNVTATAQGGTNNYGVYNISSSPIMTNVTATAQGGTNNYGVYNISSSPIMNSVTATASGGIAFNFGVYNTSSFPSMINVIATASGGTDSYGLLNTSSSLTMTNVTATASGASYSNTGVHSANNSTLSMTNVTLSASGSSTFNQGAHNDSSSLTMINGTLTASGGTNNFGLSSYGSGTHTIDNSAITGSSNTIIGSAQVGASKLNGGPIVGAVTCAGVYDENYAFFASTCP